MYYIVPVNDGLLDIDYEYLLEGIQKPETECYVKLRKGFTVQGNWTPITEQGFEAQKPIEPAPDTTKTKSPLEEIKDQLLAMDQKISQLQTDISSIKQATDESIVKQT